ncbi:MAG: methionyl-tRNA formyltransferase [Polyangia bacterium]
MTKPRVVFMGSPEFAVPCLQAVARHAIVEAVVCQPDKPAGRGLQQRAPAVKLAAEALGVPRIWQPVSVRKPPFADELRALAPDLAVVVAYGKILPAEVLAIPRLGCVNVHASLLPKYRGAAPIQWAVIHGEEVTGVTLMQMDVGMDTGPMLAQLAMKIPVDVTAGQMHERLAELGAAIIDEQFEALVTSGIHAQAQDDAQSSAAPMLDKETGRIDFSRGARAVRDLVRGCDPWPGAFTMLDGEAVKVFAATPVSGSGEAGVVLDVDRDGLIVGCGADAIALAELQLAGRKRMPAKALVQGRSIPRGTRLG